MGPTCPESHRLLPSEALWSWPRWHHPALCPVQCLEQRRGRKDESWFCHQSTVSASFSTMPFFVWSLDFRKIVFREKWKHGQELETGWSQQEPHTAGRVPGLLCWSTQYLMQPVPHTPPGLVLFLMGALRKEQCDWFFLVFATCWCLCCHIRFFATP